MGVFTLDLAGGAEVLKVMAAPVIAELAGQVAANAGPDATVKTYTTDRAAAAVSVPAEAQAKDGVLTRAASAAGLEVRPTKNPKAPRARRKKAAPE